MSRPDQVRHSLALALICGAIAPLLFAAVTIMISSALMHGSDPLALITVRTLAAALVANGLIALTFPRDDRAPLVRGIGWRSSIVGIVGLGLGPLAAYLALERVDAVAYNSIYYLQVPLLALVVPLASYPLGRPEAVFWALICVVGVALATGFAVDPTRLRSEPEGLVLSLVSMASAVLFAVFLQRQGTGIRPARLNATYMTHSAGVFLFLLVLTSGLQSIDLFVVLIGIVIGVVAWLPARILWTYALRDAGASVASALGALQPAFTALLSVIYLRVNLGMVRWAGVVLLCGAVCTLSLRVGETLPLNSGRADT